MFKKYLSNTRLLFTFAKSAFAVSILIILLNWFNYNVGLKTQFRNIPLEIWFGLLTTIGTTLWQYQSEKEKDKITSAENKSKENRAVIESHKKEFEESIASLKIRIDSVLIQMAQLRQEQSENNKSVEALEYSDRTLEKALGEYRLQYHKERIELVKAFYIELCQLNGAVSYLKGLKEGNHNLNTTERLDSILQLLGEQSQSSKEDTTLLPVDLEVQKEKTEE